MMDLHKRQLMNSESIANHYIKIHEDVVGNIPAVYYL